MLLEIEHKLKFNYDTYIHESHVELRVQPRSKQSQSLYEWHLEVGPRTRPARWAEDWLGNIFHWFSIADWHDQIEVLCRSIVGTSPCEHQATLLTDPLDSIVTTMREYEFLLFDGPIQKSEALMAAHAESSLSQASTIGEWIGMLSEYLTANFSYVPAITTYDSTVEDVLAKRAGVCQDFAHLSIGLARLSGLPARYVNGYLHQDNTVRGPSQSHAWFELWSPTCGWVPYDSTHHQDTGERHVVVAYGRNYDDAPPNRGIFAGNASEILEAEVFTRALEPEVHRAPIVRSDTLDLPLYGSAPDGVVESIEHPRHGSTEDQQQQQQQ